MKTAYIPLTPGEIITEDCVRFSQITCMPVAPSADEAGKAFDVEFNTPYFRPIQIPDPLPVAEEEKPEMFDFLVHLRRQRDWSQKTFGPGDRAKGVVDHIRKELLEIEQHPTDLEEWIDVVILALDGAWRAGYHPGEIVMALTKKQAKNEARNWPDWRTMPTDKAIEHDRTGEKPKPAAPVEVPAGYRELAAALSSPETLARKFHEAYERLAPEFNYTTRKASAVPWDSVPENNRRLMIAVCAEIAREALKPAKTPGVVCSRRGIVLLCAISVSGLHLGDCGA